MLPSRLAQAVFVSVLCLSPAASVCRAEQGDAAPEDASLRALSLDEALAYAREHHPRLGAMRARIAAALAEVSAAKARWLPEVGAMAQIVGATSNNSSTALLGTSAVDVARVGGTAIADSPSLRAAPSTAVALGIRQQLFDFGRVEAEAAALRLLADVERHRAADAALDVEAAVAQAYYAVLAAQGVYDASRAAHQRALANGERARAGVKSGLRPTIELTRAEADMARYELGVLRARGGLSVARTLFAAAVGVAEQELDARGSELALPPLEPLEALLARSLERDPALRGARARVGAQQAAAEALGAEMRPRLYATASVSGRAGGFSETSGPVPTGEGWLPAVPNWHAGVVLSWPVYDPVNVRRRDVAQSRADALSLEAKELQRTRRAQVGAAYHAAQVAMQSVAAVERAAVAARANYEQAEQRFRVGLGASVELSDAEALRVEAEIQLALARAQAAQQRAQLARALGEGP